MKIIPKIIIRLITIPEINAHGNSLRGYIGHQYPIADLCNRTEAGKLRYRVPVIQYKVLDNQAYIIGLGEGIKALEQIALDMDELILENIRYKVIDRYIDYDIDSWWGICPGFQHYQFITPWLALNKMNYQRYCKASYKEKRILLESILKGNLLAASKSMNYNITEEIKVRELHLTKIDDLFLKGIRLVGFRGNFAVNFHIPTYWGIGKSVARGFGTVK
jgi:hypothetical protein